MEPFKIAVIPGDGIGIEVVDRGASRWLGPPGRRWRRPSYDLGGRRYLATGEVLPDSVLEELRTFDAILLGAVGTPEVPPGVLERGLLLRLRFELDLYINLRPFVAAASVGAGVPIDFAVIRENTEGAYAGEGGFLRKGTPAEVATQGSVNTRFGVERCVRYAFDLARSRPRRHLTLVHKTNVLTFSGDLWQRTFDQVALEYPDVGDGVQPRRRGLHLLRRVAAALRRGGHRQPFRRHPDRPRRCHRGRHRPGRLRQPQSGPDRAVAVRAGARLGPRHRRHRSGRSDGGHHFRGHDARLPGRRRRPPAASAGRWRPSITDVTVGRRRTDRRRHRRPCCCRKGVIRCRSPRPTRSGWMESWSTGTTPASTCSTHTLHYGCGVFEGIRAYPTESGPAVFRLTDHITRLFNSAKIFLIDVPFSPEADRRGDQDDGPGQRAARVLHPAHRLPRATARWASTPCRARFRCRSRCGPGAPTWAPESVANGVRMKISSWRRHDPNAMPPAAKGTGMYINSSMAKIEALKAGYDEAILLSPQGYVSECTGENIFVVRGGRLITPPLSAGALEGITQSSVMTIARDLGFEVEIGNILRSDLYTAEEAFLSGTAAEVVPIDSVDDRVVGDGRPGPITRQLQEIFHGGRARPGRSLQGLGGACRLRPTHLTPTATRPDRRHAHAVPREMPDAVDIYDTTLRDGSQQEGLSLTVDDKLRVAEQLDHLGVQYIEGGWPGANPKDEEFFRRAAAGELRLETATLVAFGSTRKAGGQAETDPVLAGLLGAETAVVCLVAKSAAWHVTETLRTTLTEAVDMVADSVGYLVSKGRRVFLDAEHFFDGYRADPRFSTDVLLAAAARRGRGPGAVRHQRRQPAFRGGAGGRRGPRPGGCPPSAATSTTTPAARSPTPSRPSGWA